VFLSLFSGSQNDWVSLGGGVMFCVFLGFCYVCVIFFCVLLVFFSVFLKVVIDRWCIFVFVVCFFWGF